MTSKRGVSRRRSRRCYASKSIDARELFTQGMPLVERVAADMRADIRLFIQGGLATLRKIEEAGHDVWRARPKLGKWDKGKLLLEALWGRVRERVS